jgi:hypothetical protein
MGPMAKPLRWFLAFSQLKANSFTPGAVSGKIKSSYRN